MEPKDVEAREAKLEASIEKLQDTVGDLRVEMVKGDASLRQAITEVEASLRQEMIKLEARLIEKIVKSTLSNRVWMLLLSGVTLSVMARGFKWI
jgi:hypothetical protein